MKNPYVIMTLIFFAGLLAILANGSGEGIHPVGENAVVIEGSCLTVNWNISDQDLEAAVKLFRSKHK